MIQPVSDSQLRSVLCPSGVRNLRPQLRLVTSALTSACGLRHGKLSDAVRAPIYEAYSMVRSDSLSLITLTLDSPSLLAPQRPSILHMYTVCKSPNARTRTIDRSLYVAVRLMKSPVPLER